MALAPRETTLPAPYIVPPSQQWDGNDGSWSTFSINVGSPGQDFRVLISTSGSAIFLPVPAGCSSADPANCASLRGVQPFNGAPGLGFQVNESSTIGLYTLDLEARLNYKGNGLYGYDRVGLETANDKSGLSLGRQLVAGIADKSYFMGVLGLGITPSKFSSAGESIPSLLQSLRDQSLIPSLSYGYTAGASYRLNKVLGSLVIGGYEQSRFTPSSLSFPFSSDDSRTLTVGVQSILGFDTLLGAASSFTSISDGHLSFIDSTVPHIWLPRAVCDRFESAFGLTYDPTTDLYTVNDTAHSRLQQLKPTVTFKLGSTADNNGNSINIVLPYAAFDLQSSWPIYANATNYFPIRRATNDSQYTLGRTFLQEAYLVVDYERKNFSVGQALFQDPSPAQHIVPITSPSVTSSPDITPKKASTLSSGTITGIVIGVIAFFALLLVSGFLIRRKRRSESHETKEDNSAMIELSSTRLGELPSPAPQSTNGYFDPQNQKQMYAHELPSPPVDPYELPSPPVYAHELPSPPVIHEMPADYFQCSGGKGGSGSR